MTHDGQGGLTRLQSLPGQDAATDDPGAPAWFLAAISAPAERAFITVDGAHIESLACGKRGLPGLLLLHGNMAHAHWWSFIAPLLMHRHRIVAPSFSGMGGSDHRARYDNAQFAREALAAALAGGLFDGPCAPTIVGHSAGGGPTLHLAAQAEHPFAHAILLDSLIRSGEPSLGEAAGQPRKVYPGRADALRRYRLVPEQPVTNPYLVDWVAGHSVVEMPDGSGWTWHFDPALRGRFNARAAFPKLREALCPLTFVTGTQSAICTDENMQDARAHAPSGTRFLEIPAAHHHVMLDQPIALATLLLALAAS